ncbi:hypothetical protein, partial [Rhodococcus sp. NPDC058514]
VKGRRPRVAGTGSTAARAATTSESAAASSSSAEPLADPAVVEAPAAETPATEVEGTGAAEMTATAEQAPKTVNRTSSLRPRATGAAAEAPVDAGDEAADTAGWKRVAVIGLVALGLGVFALVAALRPGADVSNQAWVDTAATSKVTADAKHAIQTLYTYKFDTVEQDFDNARAVLSDGMREEFDRTAAVTKDAVIQTKTATNAEVTDIGLKLLSDDRAELVASMNVSATNDGAAQGSAQGPLSVTMAKSGDTWLIADIRDR